MKPAALVAALVVAAATGCTSTREATSPTLDPLVSTTSVLPPIATTTTTTTTTTAVLRSGTGELGSGEGTCPMWHDTAIAVGWTEADWPTLSRILYAESACDPHAYGIDTEWGNGAGLAQVMDQLWPDQCGIAPADLFDPFHNLACALHVYNVQGWQAWSTY